jgi:hypothetical protein
MVYGGGVPTLGYTITGFLNGDGPGVVGGAPSLATTANAASGVGSYPITVGLGTLSARNYDFPQLVAGTLRVTPAPLTIRADDQARVMGQPNPSFTASYVGFVNGDGPSSLTSPAVLSTTAATTSPAGVYPITVGGAESPNYTITFVPGSLSVTNPPLVMMTHVQPMFNKKHQVTQILVTFSGALDGAEADSLGTYRLTAPGKKGSFTAKNAKLIALRSAAYDAARNQVTLSLLKPYALTKPVQLRIVGEPPSGLEDSFGRLIDGNHDGQPGGDAVALLGRGGATVSAVIGNPGAAKAVIPPFAVDALLEGGDLRALLPVARSKYQSHR